MKQKLYKLTLSIMILMAGSYGIIFSVIYCRAEWFFIFWVGLVLVEFHIWKKEINKWGKS